MSEQEQPGDAPVQEQVTILGLVLVTTRIDEHDSALVKVFAVEAGTPYHTGGVTVRFADQALERYKVYRMVMHREGDAPYELDSAELIPDEMSETLRQQRARK